MELIEHTRIKEEESTQVINLMDLTKHQEHLMLVEDVTQAQITVVDTQEETRTRVIGHRVDQMDPIEVRS